VKRPRTRWNLLRRDVGHLSAALRPIRTSQEVAEILGVSASQVCQLENSALRKIVRAVQDLAAEGTFNHKAKRTQNEEG